VKKGLVGLAVGIITLFVALVAIEVYLRTHGYGHPPLYDYHPAIGYTLKPSQELTRVGGATVFINNLGLRSANTTAVKPPGVLRVLVLGDSVPYGGSYIDQKDVFCSVTQEMLNKAGKRYEVLNAGVNAYGPQNVCRLIQTRGLLDADMVIVYFPWGNLKRDFMNFYVVPFWSEPPHLALEEFFRHAVWATFGQFSRRWKNAEAFQNELLVDLNIAALRKISDYCEERKVPVFFFWSPYLDWFTGKSDDKYIKERARLLEVLPKGSMQSMDEVIGSHPKVLELYADPVHYSTEGHRFVGQFLAKFIITRFDQATLPGEEPK
jgi:hypothetical protein